MTIVFRCNTCGTLEESARVPISWQTGTRYENGEYIGLSHRCASCMRSSAEWNIAPPLDASVTSKGKPKSRGKR